MSTKTREKLIKEAGALAVGLASGTAAHSLVRQLTGEADKDVVDLRADVNVLTTRIATLEKTLDEIAPLINKG